MMELKRAVLLVRCAMERAGNLGLRMPQTKVVLCGCLLAVLLSGAPAWAQIGSERYSSIIIDAASGRELSSVNADEPRYPASLTKMMTLYLTFEALREKRITPDTLVPVSQHAAEMSPSKLGLVPGTKMTVEQAIFGLVTQSANDAAAALGEFLGGSEPAFAALMTQRAHALGMEHTIFRNASGLPNLEQTTTARDLSRLAAHLLSDFPAEYHYFSTPSFRFHGRVFTNHDHLLESYPGADGLKTGFITASGFNLVTSAVHGNVRLIGVVMGAARVAERDRHMMLLLDRGFAMMGEPGGEPRSEGRNVALLSHASAVPLPPPAPPAVGSGPRWAVRVGAFSSESAARRAAEAAHRWTDAGRIIVSPTSHEGRAAWRAELVGLGPSEASSACTVLERHKINCVVVKPEV